MGQQLLEAYFAFFPLSKFRPEFRDPSFEPDLALLQSVKQTRASKTFRRRPEENDGVRRPRLLALRVPESAVQFENLFAVPPNGNSCAEFAVTREIFVE